MFLAQSIIRNLNIEVPELFFLGFVSQPKEVS